MSGRPWYKRSGADFIEGTMGLSLEEKGAYSLCLDLIYSHGGPIADDARWIAGICNVSVRKWKSIRQSLIDAGKLIEVNGRLSNARADKELIISSETSRKLAENGASGGNKTAENKATVNENSNLAAAKVQPIDKIREEKKETPTGAVAKLIVSSPPDDLTEVTVFRYGKSVLGKNAGGVITNLKKMADHHLPEVMRLLTMAAEKENPMEWLQGVLRASHERAYWDVDGFKRPSTVIESRQDREEREAEARIYRNVL